MTKFAAASFLGITYGTSFRSRQPDQFQVISFIARIFSSLRFDQPVAVMKIIPFMTDGPALFHRALPGWPERTILVGNRIQNVVPLRRDRVREASQSPRRIRFSSSPLSARRSRKSCKAWSETAVEMLIFLQMNRLGPFSIDGSSRSPHLTEKVRACFSMCKYVEQLSP